MTAPALTSAPTPRERPILFSGEMVKALLAGVKTQTRRPVKQFTDPGAAMLLQVVAGAATFGHSIPDDPVPVTVRCPYGAPGDRVWVRETFFEEFDPITAKPYDPPRACYAATHEGEVRKMDGDGGTVFRKDGVVASPWRPGIHMPRWASRLLLEVTDVRVERVRAITDEDARSEGFESHNAFREAWWGMYGPNPPAPFAWYANPWVWVVSFRRVV